MTDRVIPFPGHLQQPMPPEIARLVDAAETAAPPGVVVKNRGEEEGPA